MISVKGFSETVRNYISHYAIRLIKLNIKVICLHYGYEVESYKYEP